MRKVTILASVIVSMFYWTSHSMAQSEKIDVEKYPDILSVKVQPRNDNHFDFDVTVSSPWSCHNFRSPKTAPSTLITRKASA